VAAMLQFFGLYLANVERYSYFQVVSYYFDIATLLPVFFALGSGAVSFASEREDGTDELLQRLSAPPGRLFACKVGIGAAGTVLMLVLLTVLAMALSFGDFPFTVAPRARALAEFVSWLCVVLLLCVGLSALEHSVFVVDRSRSGLSVSGSGRDVAVNLRDRQRTVVALRGCGHVE